MPVQKAAGITAKIGVDTVDARANINQLKRAIRQANQSFRDTANAQRAAGDSTKALLTANQGLNDRIDAIKTSIKDLNEAMEKAQRAHETGTKNYHHAQVDLQQLKTWLDSATHSLQENNRILIFHNDKLRDSLETSRHYKQMGEELEQQYRAEGNTIAANNQKLDNRRERLLDLNIVSKRYRDTIDQAREKDEANTSNPEFNRALEGLRRVEQARAELRREITLDDSKLQALNQEEANERQNEQAVLGTYEAEGRSVAANNQKLQNRIAKIQDLNVLLSETKSKLHDVNSGGYTDTGKSDALTQRVYKLREALAQTKSEARDLGSGLSTQTRYNELYNQSVNKVVERLKKLRGEAEAGRAEFRLLNRNINGEGIALGMQQKKLEQIAEANRTANDSTGKLSIAYQQQKSKVESLDTTYQTHLTRLKELNTGEGHFGALSEENARKIDLFTDRMRRNDLSAHSNLRTAHALTNGSIALGGAFLYGAKQSTTLGNEFNKIGVLAHNSGEHINDVNKNMKGAANEAVDMSEKYGVSQQKISNGLEELIRRGYSSGQAMKAMPSYLKAATASGEDLSDVINTAGSALEGFGLKNKNIGHNTKVVTNEMAASADFTASSFADMGKAMAYVGPIAHDTNQSVSQTSSALGVLANNGIKGSMAGTSLRKILQNIASFKPNNKILKSLGLGPKDFQDSNGHLKDISSIMTILDSKMQHMSKAKRTNIMQQLFGRTGSQAAAVLSDNADKIGKLNDQVTKAAKNGYTSKTSRDNMKTTEGQLLRLKAAGTELAKEYANSLMPVFSRTADFAMDLAKGLSHLPSGLKAIVAGATVAIPAFAGIAYAIATVRKAASVYLDLKKRVLTWFYKSDDELTKNAGYYDTHIKHVNSDTEALQKNNQEVQEAIDNSRNLAVALRRENSYLGDNSKNTDTNTGSKRDNSTAANNQADSNTQNSTATDKDTSSKQSNSKANDNNSESEDTNSKSADTNATAQKTDATATDTNTAAKNSGGGETGIGNGGDTLNGLSIGEGGSAAKDAEGATKSSGKMARLGGKLKGLAKGSGKLPIKGAAGTGLAIGGTEALAGSPKQGLEDGIGTAGGAIAGAPAGPIGEAIGGVIGPMITKKLGNALGSSYSAARKKARKSPASAGYTDDEIATHAKNIGNSYSNALKGMDGNTKNFVKSIGSDEQKARTNYLSHRGKMTKAQSGYYKDAVKNANNYGKSMENENKRSAKYALDHGKISKNEYNKELAADKSYYKKKSKTLNNDEKNLEKASTKGAGARKKALSKFNKDLMKMTNTSGKKQLALRRRLNNHKGALDEKSYKKTIREAKSNYRDSVNTAKKTYNTKKKAADDTYNKEVNHINGMKGLSSDKRKSLIKNAQDQHDKTLDKADDQKSKSINKAKDQRDGVVKAADDSKSSSVSDFQDIADKAENMLSGIGSTATKVKGWFSDHLGGGKGGKKVDPSTLWHGTADTQALHFASGVLPGIGKDEKSVINDGSGRELVKLPNGQFVLPSGRNVHTVLPKGTSVFNAGQTSKILGSINQPATHHADGTVHSFAGGTNPSAGKSSSMNVKTPSGGLKNTEKSTQKSMKNIHNVLDKGYKKTAKDVQGHLDDLHDKNSDSWKDNMKITKKRVSKIHDDTSDRFSDLKDNINDTQKRSNQLTDAHLDTTVSYFKHHFGMIPPISQSSMKSGVSNINSGISAIDKVLSQFGGNSSVLGMVHYAAGTSGPSMNKQLAVLNDATSGPRQEAVVSNSGRVRMPRGNNVPTLLNPGDKVLNGSDTLRALRTGLIPHYAGGLNSNGALKSLAKRYSKAPTTFTDDTFNKLTTAVGSLLAQDTTSDAKNGAQKPANNWSNAMWKYIDSLINPDNSILVQKMHELGDGHPYKFGANGPKYWDCGSLVQHALMALGISAPRTHFIGSFPTIPQSEAGPGDIVESNTHVGVVDSDGAKSYFSAYNDTEQPNILSLPLNNTNFTGAGDPYHFLRVPQLEKYNSEDQEVKSNPLTPLVKKQLGSKASGWIYKNLGDAGMDNPGGSGVGRWHYAVAQALKKNGFDATSSQIASWMQVINRETGGTGNPHLTNNWDSNAAAGIPSKGLVQTIGPTFESNKFPGHDDIFNGYDDLLAGIHYAASAYGRGPGMFSRVATTGYANGGLSERDRMAHISEGNKPEMVLPLTNKSRAVELMLKSLDFMFGDKQNDNQKNKQNAQSQSNAESIRDRRFEQELIQSNHNKDRMINKILDKMTVLIQTVQNKPVLSTTDIYNANRKVTQKKARLRNFNLGAF